MLARTNQHCSPVQFLHKVLSVPSLSTYDTVVFDINSTQFFVATMYTSKPSVVYRFDGIEATQYQTLDAGLPIAGTSFRIEEKLYLVLVNHGDRSQFRRQTPVYRWHGNRFVLHQSLETAGPYDVEHMTVGHEHFLAIANNLDGQGYHLDYDINSYIFVWRNGKFHFFQNFSTHAAIALRAFVQDETSFFAVANSYSSNDKTHNVNSAVYKWSGAQFELHQTSATGVDVWRMQKFLFLAVANNYDSSKQSGKINSEIFLWKDGRFQLFQSIPTQSGYDVHSFWACGRRMLAFAQGGNVTVYEMTGSMFQDINQLDHLECGG